MPQVAPGATGHEATEMWNNNPWKPEKYYHYDGTGREIYIKAGNGTVNLDSYSRSVHFVFWTIAIANLHQRE